VITEFRTPTFSFPFDIAAGPDGNVWFSEGDTGQIGFITPNGRITEIRFSAVDASSGITTGPDGNIWFCDLTGNNIWRYTLATKKLHKFPVPTSNAFPEDITAGPDGALWFTEGLGGKIGRITTNGVISEFGGGLHSPRSITSGPDGNVWFTLSFTPQLGRITPSGEITFFPAPNNPELLARGPGDTLLFSEFAANRIATISTTDGTLTSSGSPSQPELSPASNTMPGSSASGTIKFIAPCCLVRRSKKPPAFRNRRVAWLCDSGHTFLARLPYGIQKVTTT
jgi:virginiamycin B lyase